ncbi:MAG: WbqC family protein [Rickettsia endosymbiont of Ixodes persulcatus]|nr:WbqC family protein [Rickettsia endosymbiont of Ixodes persulcatus]
MLCAIHQPNFFPWLGYFDKIRQSDIFVFLDNVQIQKTGSSWVNRTKLNYLGKEKWFTCPIKRPSGYIRINEVEFSEKNWKEHLLNVLCSYYKNYTNYKSCYSLLHKLLNEINTENLAEFNIHIIKSLALQFNYKTIFILQSDLGIKSNATDLLIDICKKVGAASYLCGGGASGYQEDILFKENKINLIYQNFSEKSLTNKKDFIPGLSIIDYYMEYNEASFYMAKH